MNSGVSLLRYFVEIPNVSEVDLTIDDDTSMQNVMMERLIGIHEDINKPFHLSQMHLHGGTQKSTPCDWKGVSCSNHRVTMIGWANEVDYEHYRIPHLHYPWIPHTLEAVKTSSHQVRDFSTRCLPQSLVHLECTYCRISASLEIDLLPHNIESIDLANNFFIGTLQFILTPQSLRTINLEQNLIEKIVVWNTSLSSTFEYLKVRNRLSQRSPVLCRCLNKEKIDRRIQIAYA